jgi:hypothetical protein
VLARDRQSVPGDVCLFIAGQQRLDAGAERLILPTRLRQKRRSPIGWTLQRRVKDRGRDPPAFGVHRTTSHSPCILRPNGGGSAEFSRP